MLPALLVPVEPSAGCRTGAAADCATAKAGRTRSPDAPRLARDAARRDETAMRACDPDQALSDLAPRARDHPAARATRATRARARPARALCAREPSAWRRS